MIQNINELKLKIQHLNKDEQDEIIEWVQPFFDFNDYMKTEYGKSYEEIENESAQFSEEVLPEYLAQLTDIREVNQESSLNFIVGISGKIYKRYAESYDYPDSDKVEKSLTKYLELLLKYQINGK